MAKQIPSLIETYEENDKHGAVPSNNKFDEPHIYELVQGEKVVVHYWVRFPSYDFMFGIPHETSPCHKKEFGFFQFRKKKDGVASGFSLYVDQAELQEIAAGFANILAISQKQRPEEWEKYFERLKTTYAETTPQNNS